MHVPNPETYTLTKTVPFHQSREVSKFIWWLSQECRWYFNKGVKMSFDNRKLTKFDLYKAVTTLRNETGWNLAYNQMQRASINDGRKAVRLHQSTIDKKNRLARKKGKKAKPIRYAKSPKQFFRKKNDDGQSAIKSFQKLKIKNGTMKFGDFTLKLKTNEFDGMECLSYSVVEITRKITRRTRPEDRTYELHVQFLHYPHLKTDGSTIGIDIGVHNMLAIAMLEDRSTELRKMPHDAKRYKHDEISRLLSKRSKVKKHGRKWAELTRKVKRLLAYQQNVKTDCIRQTVSEELKSAKTVVVENLNITSMLTKVKSSGIIPLNKLHRQTAPKKGNNPKRNGGRGLRRAVQNASLGMVKDWITHYCLKNGITLYTVNPKYTSQACHECRLACRQSRNGVKFRCISCGMEFHADINAAINVLNRGRLEMEPFPAVGRIVERQKDGTVVFTEDRWKGKANPARCGDVEPVGSKPALSGDVEPRAPEAPLLSEKGVGKVVHQCM